MQHRIPNDPEVMDGRRSVTERPGLSRRRRRQRPRQRPELGD
jgi:hypothetical protein